MNRIPRRLMNGVRYILKRLFIALFRSAVEDIMLREHHVYGDPLKLTIAGSANVNNGLFNVSSGRITVEDFAFFGHNVSLITGTHDYTTFDLARQTSIPSEGRDIIVKRGAWISSNAVVLGPCIIGEHAVVAAGSIVTENVEAYTIVAGAPAQRVKVIERPA